MGPKAIFRLLKETFDEWNEDKASRLAAALAYYTIFSLAPLLIIVIAIAGAFLGEEAARGEIVREMQGLVGRDGAEVIEAAIDGASQPGQNSGAIASLISIGVLIFGATGVFTQLQEALNTIWEVAPKPGLNIKSFIQQRVLTFGMVLGIAFLLLVSLVISAGLAVLNSYMSHLLPGLDVLWLVVNFLISFGVIALLFAMIFKFLPDAKIAWSDVAIGAIITSLLFNIGKFLIGLYLGNSSFGSTYGAAGSLVVILAWVFYSAQILFFGAEFTQVYARRYGSQIVPSKHAVSLTEAARAQQGMPRQETLEQADKDSRRGDSPEETQRDRRMSRTSQSRGFLQQLFRGRKSRRR